MKTLRAALSAIAIISALFGLSAQAAQVHVCTLEDGTVTFSDQGCTFGGEKDAQFQLNGAVNSGARFLNENNIGVLEDAYARDIRWIKRKQRYSAPRGPDSYQRGLRERELRMEQGQVKGNGTWAGDWGASLERRELQRQRHDIWDR